MAHPLELKQLTKSYGSFTLSDVSLILPSGTITGLVGANGAGKSTTIKLILGLLMPDGGSIHLFGQEVRPGSAIHRSRLGFIQETPTLYSHLWIGELGELVAPFYPKWNKSVFRKLCAHFDLPKRTPFGKLSQGTRMKTALALSLSHDADLLILDEPTSGLDPLARREVNDLLLEFVRGSGKAVLFSTHITSDLERVADRVAFIKTGKLLIAGEKAEIQDRFILAKGPNDLLSEANLKVSLGGLHENEEVTLLFDRRTLINLPLPPMTKMEQPSFEDLLFFHGRKLEAQ